MPNTYTLIFPGHIARTFNTLEKAREVIARGDWCVVSQRNEGHSVIMYLGILIR
jgi:hypothetical protein